MMLKPIDVNLFALVVSGGVILLGLSFFAGVHHERGIAEAKLNKQIVAYIPKVQAKEAQIAIEVTGATNETETKLAELTVRNNAVVAELGRLRIARTYCDVPTSTASPGPFGTASNPTQPTNRPRTFEVDLDDVAKEVIGLGNDYDAANIRINELVSLVHTYETACKVK